MNVLLENNRTIRASERRPQRVVMEASGKESEYLFSTEMAGSATTVTRSLRAAMPQSITSLLYLAVVILRTTTTLLQVVEDVIHRKKINNYRKLINIVICIKKNFFSA